MILQQYYLNCLSHGSYLIADETTRRAVIIDPRRDVREYLQDAERLALDIVGVVNTHVHADFVAGHLELAAATGAWIGYGPTAADRADFAIRTLSDGETVRLGEEVTLEVLHTPGHTWESISVLVRRDEVPHAVMTGDCLFIGGVGRPDLIVSGDSTSEDLARTLHRSLHQVLLALPDETIVYPAHGAGSSCGKGLSDDLDSTIGAQRDTNPFLQPMTETEFVDAVTTGQASVPAYFELDAALNLRDRELFDPYAALPALFGEQETRRAIAGGVVVLDLRSPDEFAECHITGSINIGVDGRMAETAGMVIDADAEILLLTPEGREGEGTLRLGRIGFDNVIGTVADVNSVLASMNDLTQSSARTEEHSIDPRAVIVDVRNAGEREDGRSIPGSLHVPLAELRARHANLPAGPKVVHCASGWRSSVAVSLLRSLGHKDVTDLVGGYESWTAARARCVQQVHAEP